MSLPTYGKHGPNNLTDYLDTHACIMKQWQDVRRFVCYDTTKHSWESDSLVLLSGTIGCLGEILVGVEKDLQVCVETADDVLVRTVKYAYNAHVQGHFTFLRYDNAHPHDRHPDSHHKHSYEWTTGLDKPGSPLHIGEPNYPHLSEFLEEVAEWYYENYSNLPRSLSCADPERERMRNRSQ